MRKGNAWSPGRQPLSALCSKHLRMFESPLANGLWHTGAYLVNL